MRKQQQLGWARGEAVQQPTSSGAVGGILEQFKLFACVERWESVCEKVLVFKCTF